MGPSGIPGRNHATDASTLDSTWAAISAVDLGKESIVFAIAQNMAFQLATRVSIDIDDLNRLIESEAPSSFIESVTSP